MAETKTEILPDELKTAVKRLRCDHRYPCQPPHGTLWAPGPCLHCGQEHPDDDEIVPEALCGPLADLLEDFVAYTVETRVHESGALIHDNENCYGDVGKDCTCFDNALAVARVLNGGGS